MKKLIYLLAGATLLLAVSCTNTPTLSGPDSFIVKGNIEGLNNDTLYLYQRGAIGRSMDTIFTHGNSFEFEGTFKTPSIAFIRTDDGRIIQKFYVENAVIEFGGNEKEITVKGGKLTDEYMKYTDLRKAQDDLYGEIKKQMNALPKEAKEQKDSLELITDQCLENILKISENYVREHTGSYISLNELATLTNYLDPFKSEEYYNALEEPIRNSEGGLMLQKEIKELLATAVGAPAIDFTIADINGKEITLSEVCKNSYTLVDFWASWCGPCRAEIPNVKKAYAKYHDKGFEVIAISTDRDVEKWKKAVDEEQLPWIVIRDRMEDLDHAVAKAYGVRALPTTYLIGKDGKIVARNLTGAALHEKLDELFSAASQQ